MKTLQKTRGDYLRAILDDYIKEHGAAPVDLDLVFLWVKTRKRWAPPEQREVRIFKEEMARAAREDYYTDPQGREVRKKHAVVIKEGEKQRSLWADIETAPPEHMRMSLQQRRRGILGDVTQLKTDLDSYNQNFNPTRDKPIQMTFNFDEDLAEAAHDSTYSDRPPDEVPPEDEGPPAGGEPPAEGDN